MTPRRLLAAATAMLLGVGLMGAGHMPADALAAVPGTISVHGATITSEQWLTARTVSLTIATDAFTAPTHTEVTLPTSYRAQAGRRWPVTYYLAGFNHDQTAFRSYHGEADTAAFPSIVVSPDGGVGYWADWYNTGRGGPPEYETFVVDQLIPLIDANFRTIPDRAHRAVMGESGGGFGVMMLAAKHPDLFAAAASLSGGLDDTSLGGIGVVSAAPVIDGGLPDAIFGDFLTQEVRWRGDNPIDLAENLAGVDLQLISGNGVFDPARGETLTESAGCVLEAGIVRPTSITMHNALLTAGIPHRWTELSWGCHSVALFSYEISQALPRFAYLFDHPQPTPRRFNYRTIAPAFNVWGWTIKTDPSRALEFLDLHDAGRTGLTLTGSGRTTLTTARYFRPGRQVSVVVDGSRSAYRADADGRVTFTVDLGPADLQQEYTVGVQTRLTTEAVAFVPHIDHHKCRSHRHRMVGRHRLPHLRTAPGDAV